ncbi:MAG: tail fiber domain-containing protein [Sediminibacterium sp.]
MKKIFFIVSFLFVGLFVKAQTGIGTTVPVNKFEVVASNADPASSGSSANGNLRLGATASSHVLDFGLSSSSNYAWLQARLQSNYGTNYSLVLNPNGGNVGIGTTSPAKLLTVGREDGSLPAELQLNPAAASNEGGQIFIKRSRNGSTQDWTIDQYGTTAADARFRIFNGTTESSGLIILENGNVGLGTATPTARLNLVGGGMRMFAGFGNSTSRPGLNTGTIGNYEIRGVGAGGGSTQVDGADDGFLRLSAGGGTNSNTQSSIDLSGYSNVADMSNNIVMRTAGTERFRLTNIGCLGLGTSSPTVALHVQNGNVFSGSDDPSTNTIPSLYVYNTNTASTSAHATSLVRTAGTGSGKPYYSLDVNGSFGYSIGINNPNNQMIINTTWNFNTVAANNAITINRFGQSRVAIPEQGGQIASDWPGGWGGGLATYDFLAFGILANSFNTRSDRRLKNNIVELDTSSISKYLKLRPVTFYWNPDKQRDTKLQYGFIAQEIESIFPEMVNIGTDSMQTKSVNYQALHALSLKVIQAQQAEIELLKKKQIEFEARLLRLEAKINY